MFRITFIRRALMALGVVGGLFVTGAIGTAAIFNPDLSAGAGSNPMATPLDGWANAPTPTGPFPAGVINSPDGSPSGCVLQVNHGGVVHLTPGAAWSPQDLRSDNLRVFAAASRDEKADAADETNSVAEPLPNGISNGADRPLAVGAKSHNAATPEVTSSSFHLSTILPRLTIAAICVWLAFYFIRCLHPYHELPHDNKPPRRFFGMGRKPPRP